LGGHWTLDDENFLGNTPQDDRTMHYAIVLPTRQILVVNGGNFDFYGPVSYPWLLTPKFDGAKKFTGYDKQRMAEAVEPRLYHNAALLMPDGRVWVSGGNTARAGVRSSIAPQADATQVQTRQPKPDLSLVDLDLYFFNDGPIGKGMKGMLTTPTENWVAEIYSPPYWFIDGDRQVKILHIAGTGAGEQKVVAGETYYLLRSFNRYALTLIDTPASCTTTERVVLIKLPSATHGWENGQKFYELETFNNTPRQIAFTMPDADKANLPPAYYMLFYVDCKGKPSHARMVRIDSSAKEP
jgi:hypothetical protein